MKLLTSNNTEGEKAWKVDKISLITFKDEAIKLSAELCLHV